VADPSGVAWLTKKSRASRSASASQVTTLMPRARALRSTVDRAARFSTLTAIASTPRVIHASTTSFCLAASSSVGPSQSSSTPRARAAESAPRRALMKYGSPLAFGMTAITGRRVVGAPEAAGVAAPGSARRAARRGASARATSCSPRR
jgi:hypothetical protein